MSPSRPVIFDFSEHILAVIGADIVANVQRHRDYIIVLLNASTDQVVAIVGRRWVRQVPDRRCAASQQEQDEILHGCCCQSGSNSAVPTLCISVVQSTLRKQPDLAFAITWP